MRVAAVLVVARAAVRPIPTAGAPRVRTSAGEPAARHCVDSARRELRRAHPVRQGAPEVQRELPDARRSAATRLTLVVTVEHGKGETVLPTRLSAAERQPAKPQSARSAQASCLPDPEGAAGAQPRRTERAASARRRRVRIPVVAVAAEAGAPRLILPPLADRHVARERRDRHRVHARRTRIVSKIRSRTRRTRSRSGNPPAAPAARRVDRARSTSRSRPRSRSRSARSPRWLISRWLRRPKKRRRRRRRRARRGTSRSRSSTTSGTRGLLARAVSPSTSTASRTCVRRYLGARYGFDGLESTTDETLGRAPPSRRRASDVMPDIEAFLRDAIS